MAIDRNTRYPGRFDAPTAARPQGAFKNRSAPGAKDGSYLERDWANDWDGFFGSLLRSAGLTPNGTPDTALASQYFDALRALGLRQATESVTGVSKFSTTAAALAGEDDTTSMTPLKVKQVLYQKLPSTGDIVITSANTAPPGTLKANGSAVSRTTYSALFAVIGTTYGAGDGSTTFSLPEARAEGIRGWDDGRGVDTGRALGSAQLDSVRSIGIYSETGNPFGGGGGTGAGYLKTSSSGAVIIPPGTETRGRNIAFLICIRY